MKSKIQILTTITLLATMEAGAAQKRDLAIENFRAAPGAVTIENVLSAAFPSDLVEAKYGRRGDEGPPVLLAIAWRSRLLGATIGARSCLEAVGL